VLEKRQLTGCSSSEVEDFYKKYITVFFLRKALTVIKVTALMVL